MENNEGTIDLKVLFKSLLLHWKFIVLVTLIFTVGAFCVTKFFITEQYTATAQIYVDSRTNTDPEAQLSYSELTANEKLVGTCRILFTGDKMANCIVDDLKNKYNITDYSVGAIKSMISVEAASADSMIMNVRVVSDDAEVSAIIANLVLSRAGEVYEDIIGSGVVKTVNNAVIPAGPSSPNTSRNITLGFVLGFVFSCVIVAVLELIDTKVKPTDDLEKLYGVPLFAEILDFEFEVKGGY